MAKKITLQTPNVEIEVKNKAEKVAKKAGFSSLQDVVRLVLHDIAEERLPLRMSWSVARDPEVRESIAEFMRDEHSELAPEAKLSDVLAE